MSCVAGPSSLDLEASSGDKCPSVQSVPSVHQVPRLAMAPKADLSIEHPPLITRHTPRCWSQLGTVKVLRETFMGIVEH